MNFKTLCFLYNILLVYLWLVFELNWHWSFRYGIDPVCTGSKQAPISNAIDIHLENRWGFFRKNFHRKPVSICPHLPGSNCHVGKVLMRCQLRKHLTGQTFLVQTFPNRIWCEKILTDLFRIIVWYRKRNHWWQKMEIRIRICWRC